MSSLLVICVSYRRTVMRNLFATFLMMYEKRTDFYVDFPSTYEMKKCLLFEQKQWNFLNVCSLSASGCDRKDFVFSRD